MDMMNPKVKYAGAFGLESGEMFVDRRTKIHFRRYNVVVIPSVNNSRTECPVFSDFQALSNDLQLFPSLKSLSVDVVSGKNLYISNVDRSIIYSSESNEVELLTEAAHYVIRNKPTKNITFVVASFYNVKM